MEDPGFLQFGIAGVMAGLVWKMLDLLVLVLRNYYKEKKQSGQAETQGSQIPQLLDRRQSDQGAGGVMMAKLDDIIRRLKRLEVVVIDGNGRDPITTQLAVLKTQVDNHIADAGQHTAER